MATVRFIVLCMLWLILMANAICFAMSFVVWQVVGIFWYGIGLIVCGVSFKALFDKVFG